MTNIDKNKLVDDLLAHLSSGQKTDEADIQTQAGVAQAAEDDEYRADDVSHENEAGDMHALFQEVDARQDEVIKQAKALDLRDIDTVRPGAVIELDGANYIVGVPTSEFTSQGATFSGISADAPIYAQLEGLKAGDTFEFNGRQHTVGSVQ